MSTRGKPTGSKWVEAARVKDMVEVSQRLFRFHREPEHLQSDSGAEFMAEVVQKGLQAAGVSPLFLAPGSPWENG